MTEPAETRRLFCASPDVVACQLDQGAALLDLSSSTYYSMNPVGAHVWTLLQQPSTIDDICRSVAALCAIPQAMCRADIARLMDQFSTARLVTVTSVA